MARPNCARRYRRAESGRPRAALPPAERFAMGRASPAGERPGVGLAGGGHSGGAGRCGPARPGPDQPGAARRGAGRPAAPGMPCARHGGAAGARLGAARGSARSGLGRAGTDPGSPCAAACVFRVRNGLSAMTINRQLRLHLLSSTEPAFPCWFYPDAQLNCSTPLTPHSQGNGEKMRWKRARWSIRTGRSPLDTITGQSA